MKTHLSIVTGSSRGLGQALTRQLLDRGHHVLGLARGATDLQVPAGATLTAWQADLAQPLPVAQRLQAWLEAQDPGALASVTLINNAALVTEPAPLSQTALSALSDAARVSLEAPLLLSAAFLRATAAWPLPRRLLLVSSGLGRRAMAGAAAYCAVKAGLDHLARALALEEAGRPWGARVVALAPGVIDTDMQRQLRGADPVRFPDQARFQALKDEGQLDSPQANAAKLLRALDRDDFGSQPVADVRELT